MPRGKVNSPNSADKKITNARVFIENADSDPEIAQRMASVGYTKKEMAAGRCLLEEAEQRVIQHASEYGAQMRSTQKLEAKWDEADEKFAVTRRVATILFGKSSSDKRALALNGLRSHALSKWVIQAKTLYMNLLANKRYLDAMAQHKWTKTKLEQELKRVEEVEKLNVNQENLKGEAQKSTKERNRKVGALDAWMSKAVQFARIALSDKPQLLEKLGITVES